MTALGAPGGAGGSLRRLMARWPTGVAVVTSRSADGDAGLTVNALLSVSLDPPLLLVSLTEAAETTPVIRSSGAFVASLLAADQRPLSERFALTASQAVKFAGVGVHRGPSGIARIDGALGAIDCRVRSMTPAGDHVLVLADVVDVEIGRDAPPLVFFHRGYATAGPAGTLTLPPPRE